MPAVKQNLTNHIFIVLDASYSMQHLQEKVVKVTDELISSLAKDSVEKIQETRVSVYTFADTARCDIWDMDVMRLPSMKDLYSVRGNTALVDATFLALDDAELITEKYNDHAFLVFVLTDGEENASRGDNPHIKFGCVPRDVLAQQMRERIMKLGDNRTVSLLVPNDQGYRQAKEFGFDNIAIWDATTEAGLEAAVDKIKTATRSYMDNRAKGVRSTKSLFVGADVDAAAVKAAKLVPLPTAKRKIVRVTRTDDSFEKVVKPVTKSRLKPEMGWFVEIEKFVKRINKGVYPVGDAFYELVKTEKVQGDKEIAVVENNTNKVYVGAGARQLLGLPEEVRTVKPGQNPDYTIFVQSSSLNRHLPHGCQIMIINR